MILRTLLRSSAIRTSVRPALRSIQSYTRYVSTAPSQSIFHSLSKLPPPTSRNTIHANVRRRYAGNYRPDPKRGRVVHTRWDEQELRKARPLLDERTLHNLRNGRAIAMVILVSGGFATVFYYSNLETVPVSGRRRFNCYSDETVEQEGVTAYNLIMQEARNAILPDFDRRSKQVKRVMKRLIPQSGLENVDWEVHVINSDECNAFVLPGGKVFVYSGILKITQTDDGLAAVLGHEIAHNVARHQAEQMSGLVMLVPVRWALSIVSLALIGSTIGAALGDVFLDLGIMRRASRKQESEADYIGMMMMAQGCYDPSACVAVWERMEAAQRGQDIPQWLSTHPSNSTRITQMQEWLPKAEDVRNQAECSETIGFATDFRRAMVDPWGVFASSR